MRIALGLALLIALAAPLVGTSAAVAATAHRTAPAAPLFAWVPAGGFPDRFPFGQCTWWVAYNRQVSWSGNAADWLANAHAAGRATAAAPSLGAIAVFRPGGRYSAYGHVAIVTAVSGERYVVSEMNAPAWGAVTTRAILWPDPEVLGFIPLASGERP